MCHFTTSSRLTPEQCLRHPWLRKLTNGKEKTLDKTNLKKYMSKQRWNKAKNTLTALKRMGAMLTTRQNPEQKLLSKTRSSPNLNIVLSERESTDTLHQKKNSTSSTVLTNARKNNCQDSVDKPRLGEIPSDKRGPLCFSSKKLDTLHEEFQGSSTSKSNVSTITKKSDAASQQTNTYKCGAVMDSNNNTNSNNNTKYKIVNSFVNNDKQKPSDHKISEVKIKSSQNLHIGRVESIKSSIKTHTMKHNLTTSGSINIKEKECSSLLFKGNKKEEVITGKTKDILDKKTINTKYDSRQNSKVQSNLIERNKTIKETHFRKINDSINMENNKISTNGCQSKTPTRNLKFAPQHDEPNELFGSLLRSRSLIILKPAAKNYKPTTSSKEKVRWSERPQGPTLVDQLLNQMRPNQNGHLASLRSKGKIPSEKRQETQVDAPRVIRPYVCTNKDGLPKHSGSVMTMARRFTSKLS